MIYKHSDPYRTKIPVQHIKHKKKWCWDGVKALKIGGTPLGFGISQLLLILIIDLPKHDCRAPFARIAMFMFLFTFFALCGISRKVVEEYYSE